MRVASISSQLHLSPHWLSRALVTCKSAYGIALTLVVLDPNIKVDLRYAVGVYDLLACPLSPDDCTGRAQAR